MKILILNYEYPPLGGGSATAARILANGLANSGHSVTVLTSSYSGLKQAEKIAGINIVRLPVKRKCLDRSNPLEMLTYAFMAIADHKNIIKSYNFDKTIAYFTIPSGIPALFYRLVYKKPYIVSLRGGDVPGFQKKELFLWHLLTFPLILLIWLKAEFVVANSKSLKQLAEKTAKLIRKKVKIINNAVDISNPIISSRTSRCNNLLYVGRLVKQKSIDTLVRAVKIMEMEGIANIKVIIVGDGPELHNIKKLIKELKPKGKFIFTGWKDRLKLVSVYRNADILISTSLYEGMSNTILESLASGLPVIATSIPGNIDLIKPGYNGFLFEPKNPRALADIIKNIHENPDIISKMRRNALSSAKEYDPLVNVSSYINLLRKCEA